MTMALVVLSGRINAVRESTENVNHVGYYVRFRIDSRPVTTALRVNLSEGDLVVAVAKENPQEPEVVALRNETTKIVHKADESAARISVFMIILGIATIPFFGIGLYLIWMSWHAYRLDTRRLTSAREANRLLDSPR
jgi:hypothetical protein